MSSVCTSNQENTREENSGAVIIEEEDEFEQFEDCPEDEVADDGNFREVTNHEELRRLRHWVWRYFIPLGKKKKRYKFARCIACSRSIRKDLARKHKLKKQQEFDVPARTERNMPDHLRNCPKLTVDERRAVVGNSARDVGKKRKLEVDVRETQGSAFRQAGVDSYFRKYSEKFPTSANESIDASLARLVIEGNVSFRTIEKDCFHQFAKLMCPSYSVPSRYTFCTTITYC
eukprot:gb/GECG01003989.1/.p1 GENE.gb/GECG01003989.1/~~gb/GECG01003989.1/.p1  ORF type:complete len:231 (+),score=30.67 gb/GECG01003989.1/:1-693(+)